MSMCVKEKYSARELARQIDSGYYERYILSQKPFTPAIEESKRATGNVFLAIQWWLLDFCYEKGNKKCSENIGFESEWCYNFNYQKGNKNGRERIIKFGNTNTV